MKRIAFYLFWEKEGIVDRYIPYCLEKLREHVEHIVVISNGPLSSSGRVELERVADEVWERDNVGGSTFGATRRPSSDSGFENCRNTTSHPAQLHVLRPGLSLLRDVREDGFLGTSIFWGIAEHGEIDPHYFASGGVLPTPYSVLTGWPCASHFSCRRVPSLLGDDALDQDVRSVRGPARSPVREVLRGTRVHLDVVYRREDFPGDNPILDDVVQITMERCPILKRARFSMTRCTCPTTRSSPVTSSTFSRRPLTTPWSHLGQRRAHHGAASRRHQLLPPSNLFGRSGGH